jgi:dTDP-4-amino-4,6-dideoxygalactose transaminase
MHIIPFVDLRRQYDTIREEILAEIHDVLDRTAFICGEKTARFERAFAEAHGAHHCLGLSSGTDALHLALWALKIGPGDEVIVPVNTFIATSETVSLLHATPVFVDHDPDTYNIDVNQAARAVTRRTRAIIPVHLYGQPAELDAVCRLAGEHNFSVVEDCSQAHLATYRQRPIGTFGRVGTFSFYPGKNLGAYGEAGGVLTNDDALYRDMLRLRQHGSVERYVHELEGHNYRMEEIQAAVLWVKLARLREWTRARQQAASLYDELLSDIDAVRCPVVAPDRTHVYHLYVIQAERRDELRSFLEQHGVRTGLHYPIPLHLQQAYQRLGYRAGDFPVAEAACKRILSLPMFPEITRGQILRVAETIRRFYDD